MGTSSATIFTHCEWQQVASVSMLSRNRRLVMFPSSFSELAIWVCL